MLQPDLQREIGRSAPPSSDLAGNLFDAVPDAMVATDIDGMVVAVNAEGGRMLGRDPESLAGVPFVELIAEDSRGAFAVHRRTLLAGRWETAPELEVDLVHASGRMIPVDATVGIHDSGDSPLILMVLRDVADRVKTQEVLERRVALDELVVRISGRLNTPSLVEIDDEIRTSLQELGEFAGADRSYIVEVSADGGTVTTTHEWCAPGLEAGTGLIVDQPFDALPWVAGQLSANRVVQIASPDRLPPAARAERRRMLDEGIRSSLIVPMMSGAKVAGMLGLDAITNQAVRWPADAISTFVVLQDFLMNAVQRKQVSTELQRANRILQAVTRCNDALVRATDEEELLHEVCRVVVEAGDFAMAWVGYAADDAPSSIMPVAHWGVGADYVENLQLSWWGGTGEMGPAGTAVRTRAPVAVQNIAGDPEFEPWRANAVAHGFASTV